MARAHGRRVRLQDVSSLYRGSVHPFTRELEIETIKKCSKLKPNILEYGPGDLPDRMKVFSRDAMIDERTTRKLQMVVQQKGRTNNNYSDRMWVRDRQSITHRATREGPPQMSLD